MLRIEADRPFGSMRLVWSILDCPESVEEGDWHAQPDDVRAVAISIPRRRFMTHSMLTIVAKSGKRVWRREVLFALDGGAPLALVIGGEPEDACDGQTDVETPEPASSRVAELSRRLAAR